MISESFIHDLSTIFLKVSFLPIKQAIYKIDKTNVFKAFLNKVDAYKNT